MSAQPASTTASPRRAPHATRVADFGVDLYGPVDLVTGLGTSARGFADALCGAGVPVHLVPTGSLYEGVTSVDPGLRSDPRRFPVTIEHVNADSTERFLWHFAADVAGARSRVAVWYWELAAFRPDWIPNVRHYDEIWVASRFVQRSVSAITNVPVVVVPPPVTVRPSGNLRPVRERFGIPQDEFVFLYVFDYSSYVDRKNPFCLVDAFVDEFGDAQGVRLVLKLSHADPLASGYRRLLDEAQAHESITVIPEMFDDADLESLFRTADCYVSPHRSEGFGLTLAEAMLRDCPVIATDYGATTDFLTPETGFPLEYQLVELEEDQGPYPRGYVWADPSREHLRRLLRQVVSDKPEAQRRAKEARRRISEEYSRAAAGERMRRRLAGLYGEIEHA
jgi:glycosyltransferase involved in cell wall biosynthesis